MASQTTRQYSLQNPARLIRFSKRGYRPRTKVHDRTRIDVVLEPGSDEWMPPICDSSSRRRFGGFLKFTAPPGARLHKTRDVDYETVAILYRGAGLEFGSGPHWSNGLPVAEVFSEMALVRERDVRSPLPDGVVAEYRGIRTNGTHWRFVGTFIETISYDNADAIAAQYFDLIIDTMCFAHG